jgi:hypothetical protein
MSCPIQKRKHMYATAHTHTHTHTTQTDTHSLLMLLRCWYQCHTNTNIHTHFSRLLMLLRSQVLLVPESHKCTNMHTCIRILQSLTAFTCAACARITRTHTHTLRGPSSLCSQCSQVLLEAKKFMYIYAHTLMLTMMHLLPTGHRTYKCKEIHTHTHIHTWMHLSLSGHCAHKCCRMQGQGCKNAGCQDLTFNKLCKYCPMFMYA